MKKRKKTYPARARHPTRQASAPFVGKKKTTRYACGSGKLIAMRKPPLIQ